MSLFLLTFFLIYGGAHYYLYVKIQRIVPLGRMGVLCLVVVLVVMVLTPLLVRIFEHHGYQTMPRLLAYIGYTWMGLLFFFLCLSIIFDLYRLFVLAVEMFFGWDFFRYLPSHGWCLWVSFVGAVAATLYGYFEAQAIRIEHVVVESPKIPASIGKLTIVQVSDVHLGLIISKKRLEKVIEKINSVQPDILVSSGDLVDGQINGLAGLAELLHEVNPPLGKFAVTGNHEMYAGLDHSLDFMARGGFRVLRNDAVNVAGSLTIAGVDDPAIGLDNRLPQRGEQTTLAGISREKFTIFLKHRPIVLKQSLGLFDLQLSGHVHKGQLFPFNLITHLFYPVKTGYSRYLHGSSLYVSRGTGTWGPPVRFLAPPEITVFHLMPLSS